MRFVPVKSEASQARAMVFRTRDLLVRQRTQAINALRGHLAEFGIVVAQGPVHLDRLRARLDDAATSVPPMVREIAAMYFTQIDALSEQIATLNAKLRTEASQGETTTRLQTMPGIGPVCAMAIEAFAPPMAHFRRGRDLFAGRPVPRTGR